MEYVPQSVLPDRQALADLEYTQESIPLRRSQGETGTVYRRPDRVVEERQSSRKSQSYQIGKRLPI